MTNLSQKFFVMAEFFMNDSSKSLWLEWLEKADEDLLSLEALLKHKEGSPSTGCFLAQQAVEKLLKAIFIFHGSELEKLHDLIALANKAKVYESGIVKFLDKLATITRYYIETRYPGDYPEFTWDECEKAHEVAKDLKEFVISKLKKST